MYLQKGHLCLATFSVNCVSKSVFFPPDLTPLRYLETTHHPKVYFSHCFLAALVRSKKVNCGHPCHSLDFEIDRHAEQTTQEIASIRAHNLVVRLEACISWCMRHLLVVFSSLSIQMIYILSS